jgi:hypothetical protein
LTGIEGLLKTLWRALPAVAVVLAGLALCGPAGAANVTVGPSLAGSWEASACVQPWCTFVNTAVEGPGRTASSPVDGAIVGFSVVGGSTAGSYRVRTGSQLAELGFDFAKAGPPVPVVPNAGIQSYETLLPVTKGQSIALGVGGGASMAFREGGHYTEWIRELPDSGESPGQAGWPENVGYNVEIQPAPTIADLSATSGPLGGGTEVTITGTDLEGATAVAFGGTPVARIAADSETRIKVEAPPSAKAASVAVTVTTVAGKAVGPRFSYGQAGPTSSGEGSSTPRWVVPKLKGKLLKAAKAALAKAHCGLGKVTRAGGATTKTGKVSSQGPQPGKKLAAGAKVKVTLRP